MLNYKKIITPEEIIAIGQEKYEFAVKEGIYYSEYFKRMYVPELLTQPGYLYKRSLEIVKGRINYKEESEPTKMVIAANIMFPDNTRIIEMLLSKNITYSLLCQYSNLISKMKKVTLVADKLLSSDEGFTIANKQINKLCLLFRKYYGIDKYELAIAKINELVVHHKDLYLSLENKHTK